MLFEDFNGRGGTLRLLSPLMITASTALQHVITDMTADWISKSEAHKRQGTTIPPINSMKDRLERGSIIQDVPQQILASSSILLINDPDILLLDEPTASLDPDVGDYIRSYIENFASKKGTTILLASHNMNEVERLCDSIIMMKKGKVIDRGTCKEIIKKHGRINLEETFLKLARSKDELQ